MQSVTQQPERSVLPSTELHAERECAACGSVARRATARFCATCGHLLNESYLPADSLRASYYLQQQRLDKQGQPQQQSNAPQRRQHARVKPASHIHNANGASTTALAFVTYSLVPYLGILFCPGAIVMGSVGLLKWHRAPQRGGQRASYAAIILGLVILCAQILLWWILYKVPQWAKL